MTDTPGTGAAPGADGPVDRRGFLRLVGAGAAVTGTSATASAQEGDGGGGDGEGGGGGGGGETHTVDMTDSLVYEPAELTIAPGDTVVWENVGQQGHTVTAYEDEIPEGATYFASGGFESEEAARNDAAGGDIPGGESYEHTFQTVGTFGYFCIPHEGPGMIGTVEVAEGGGGGGGSAEPVVSQSAQMLGVATSIALAATLGLAYFFMRFGGNYQADD